MTATPPAVDPTLRVVLCQLDLSVGDLDGNVEAMAAAYRRAADVGADLVVFPELAICGYPPEDLLLKRGFIEQSQRAVGRLAEQCRGHAAAVVGWIEGQRIAGADPHDAEDGPWNAAAVLHSGEVVGSYRKQALPNYGPFDEKRYFDPGPSGQPMYVIGGARVALTVCEDAWVDPGPVSAAAGGGAQIVVNLNASPFHQGRLRQREQMVKDRSSGSSVPFVYLNLVGGQDELVFDGGSMVADRDGRILAQAAQFREQELLVDVPLPSAPERVADDSPVVVVTTSSLDTRPARPDLAEPATPRSPGGPIGPAGDRVGEVWNALVLGTHDYLRKNGFTDAAIGLSGGVDSSIVAAIAADALGPDRVHGVLMPSRYSSDGSVQDAVALASNLGIDQRSIPIEAAHTALLDMLTPSFAGMDEDLTEENLQSRIRGVLLMALSNKFGWMVLTTGNKSETAVGYSTLYGDTAGGLAVIKDVPKLLVYELCRWRNEQGPGAVIPESVLTKAPSAELRPDQRDDQSLPPYEVLDPLIAAYVDGDMTVDELVDVGHERSTVERISTLIDRAEYKRRQSPPGIRISQKSFGRDRRLPITNRS